MTNASGKAKSFTSDAYILLWIWTIVSALAAGIFAGNAFPAYSGATGESQFNVGALFIGVLVGAFSTLPFWALYLLGSRGIELVLAHKGETARLRAAVSGLGEAGAPGAEAVTTGPAAEAPGEFAPAAGEPDSVLSQLLADPAIREQAAKTRRTYSRKVAAEFLTRKAAEAGHDGVAFTSADLPEDL